MRCAALFLARVFGQDQLVLQAVLPAHQLRHSHAVALRLQVQAAQHVGELTAHLARVQRVAPQLGQRRARQVQRLVLAQESRRLRLTARHQHHVACLLLQSEGNRIIGGRVAGMQRRHHVDLRRQFVTLRGLLHRQRQKAHALETQPLRQLARLLDQFLPRLDAVDGAGLALAEEQVVDDEAEIGLARPMVGQRDVRVARAFQLQQDLLDETEQVVHLLELAARILVQAALARENVQLLQQFDRLAGAQRFLHLACHGIGLGRAPTDLARLAFGPTGLRRPLPASGNGSATLSTRGLSHGGLHLRACPAHRLPVPDHAPGTASPTRPHSRA